MRIVRDLLIAGVCLSIALAVTIWFPHLGRWFERVIFRSRLPVFLSVCIAVSVLTSALFAYFVLDHTAYIQDEITMQFQAKILAGGRLAAPAPQYPEFFDCENMMVRDGKWYGKYFFGQAIALVPGIWAGMPWLVHPILGGVAIWLTYAIGATVWNQRLGRLGALLMTLSPFRVVTFAMLLAHASSLIMLGFFALAAAKLVRDPARWGWGLTAGLSLGLACNSRPLTAISIGGAIALVAAIALPWKKLTLSTMVAFALSLGLFAIIFFAYNKAITGDARLPPFNQWSKTDHLGFGPELGLEYWADRDKGHSLRKGLFKDVYFNLEGLRVHEIGWGAIVFAFMAIPLFARRYRWLAIVMAAPVVAVAAAHVLHVSNGVILGQARYWSESMPMMLLLAALGIFVARAWLPTLCGWLGIGPTLETGRTTLWVWCLVLTLWSIPAVSIPLVETCLGDFLGQSPNVRNEAQRQKLDNALVFITTGHYRTHMRGGRVDLYPCGFMLNDPDLKGRVIYARDLGPEKNKQLIALYPGRTLYRTEPNVAVTAEFLPYEPVTTHVASAGS